MPWGLSTNHRGREVIEVAKRIVEHWHLFIHLFLFFTATSSLLLYYAFVESPYICTGKMLRISSDFFSESARSMLLKFPSKKKKKKIKNLLLQNRGCLRAESSHKSSDTEGLLKFLKFINGRSYINIFFLRERSSLRPYAFVWAPYICMGKVLRISNYFSSEAAWPLLLKFHVEPPWTREQKIAKIGAVLDQDGRTPIYGKNL